MADNKASIDVRLTSESYVNVLTCLGVSDLVLEEAVELADLANAQRDHPEQGELYIAQRSDRQSRSASVVMPANARTAAHENKHHTLVKVIFSGTVS